MSCREPNIQQVPQRSERSKRIRDIFVAAPGKVFIVADLSQIELRVLAHYTQDPNLTRAYKEGLDLHAMTAETVFGADFTPEQRSLAKNGNFSIIFGAGPGTLVRRYGFPSERVARQVLEGFYATYEEVGPWRQRILELAYSRRKGKTPPYVKTVLGRKRRLPGLLSSVPKNRYGAQRQAVSSIIQGSAADLFKVAVINCDDALIETGWDAHILMVVHDELVVEVPECHAEAGLTLVKHCLESIENPFKGGPILDVPLVADANIVSRWSDAK
jgi:DNA polymerase-1